MQTTTFRFIFPDSVSLAMDAGRALIAGILKDVPRANEIFHYAANGSPLPGGMPLVRMHSRRNLFDITTLGEETTKLFETFVPQIYGGFLQKFGTLPAIQLFKSDVHAHSSDQSYTYLAYSVILDRGLGACEKFEKMSETERVAKAHAVLLRGLERQANALFLDLPPDMPELDETCITKYHPRAPIVTHEGVVLQHGVSVNIGFRWPAKISGSWAVGGLTSKGHGRIWYTQGSADGVTE